jgi:Ala-tRNA(Pro) deacylase
MAIAETVKTCLEQNEIPLVLVPHPKTYSTHDSAEAAHVGDDHMAKAVVVRDVQGFAMVVIPGDHWLKLDALHNETGRDFALADEVTIDALFKDCKPGAIPPLGPAYGIETFLDNRLTSLANVYFEAGDHEELVHVSGENFQRLLKGVRHGYFSHNEE